MMRISIHGVQAPREPPHCRGRTSEFEEHEGKESRDVRDVRDTGDDWDRERSTDGCTPLLSAVIRNDKETVKLLLAKPDVEVNRPDKRYKTPLYWAIVNGVEVIIRLLLTREDLNLDTAQNGGIYRVTTPVAFALHCKKHRAAYFIQEEIDRRRHRSDSLKAPFMLNSITFNENAIGAKFQFHKETARRRHLQEEAEQPDRKKTPFHYNNPLAFIRDNDSMAIEHSVAVDGFLCIIPVPTASIPDSGYASKVGQIRYSPKPADGIRQDLREGEVTAEANDACSDSDVSVVTAVDQERAEDLVNGFLGAVFGALPTLKHQFEAQSMPDIKKKISDMLDVYSNEVVINCGTRSRRRAIKQFQQLRSGVARQFIKLLIVEEDELDKFDGQGQRTTFVEEHGNTSVELPNVEFKVNNWNTDLSGDDWSKDDDQSDYDFDEAYDDDDYNYEQEIKNQLVHEYMTSHLAFDQLLGKIQDLITPQYGSQMARIRRRIESSLLRPPADDFTRLEIFNVLLRLNWEIESFLVENYDLGLAQDLGSVLVITGTTNNPSDAYMTTIYNYLKETWPSQPFPLLKVLQAALVNSSEGKTASIVDFSTNKHSIHINLARKTFFITGSVDYIVIVAQQAAWLVSVCRSQTSLACDSHNGPVCLTSLFKVAASPQFGALSLHLFQVSSEVAALPVEQPIGSCWHQLAGRTIIATGFPIPERHNLEKGLETQISILAALGGAPLMCVFDEGIVVKGRSLAFIPTSRIGNSVQWHLVIGKNNDSPLTYNEVNDDYPNRLRVFKTSSGGQCLREEDLQATRVFLGWTNHTKNHVGTINFAHTNIGSSNATHVNGRFVKFVNAALGFSMNATATATFTLGKHQSARSIDEGFQYTYTQALIDAKVMQVILLDTETQCAWQIDCQRFLLHTMLCCQAQRVRRAASARTASRLPNAQSSYRLKSADCCVPESVEAAMEHDVEMVLSKDFVKNKTGLQDIFYYAEVFQWFERLKILRDACANEEKHADWDKTVRGFEYEDFIERKDTAHLKTHDLVDQGGQWPAYARDISALVLFGSGYGDLIEPLDDGLHCPASRNVPQGHDILCVEIATLESIKSQFRWHCSAEMLTPCNNHSHKKICSASRIQKFSPVTTSELGSKSNITAGAALFGQTNPVKHLPRAHSRALRQLPTIPKPLVQAIDSDNRSSDFHLEESLPLISTKIDSRLRTARTTVLPTRAGAPNTSFQQKNSSNLTENLSEFEPSNTYHTPVLRLSGSETINSMVSVGNTASATRHSSDTVGQDTLSSCSMARPSCGTRSRLAMVPNASPSLSQFSKTYHYNKQPSISSDKGKSIDRVELCSAQQLSIPRYHRPDTITPRNSSVKTARQPIGPILAHGRPQSKSEQYPNPILLSDQASSLEASRSQIMFPQTHASESERYFDTKRRNRALASSKTYASVLQSPPPTQQDQQRYISTVSSGPLSHPRSNF